MSSTGIEQQQLDTAKAPQLDETKSIQNVPHGLKDRLRPRPRLRQAHVRVVLLRRNPSRKPRH